MNPIKTEMYKNNDDNNNASGSYIETIKQWLPSIGLHYIFPLIMLLKEVFINNYNSK